MSHFTIKSKEPLCCLVANSKPTNQLFFQPFYTENGSMLNTPESAEILTNIGSVQTQFEKMFNINVPKFNFIYTCKIIRYH